MTVSTGAFSTTATRDEWRNVAPSGGDPGVSGGKPQGILIADAKPVAKIKARTTTVTLDAMSDAEDITADELDHLARSLAVDESPGLDDTIKVVEVLRRLARLVGHGE